MAGPPFFENRPNTDLPGLQSALVRYFQGLKQYLDENPGGDTASLQAEVAQLQLDLAALAARAPSTDGSIFSMVGPGGATPVVAYNFTKRNPSLTPAQNLTAANLSGVSAYDLISDNGNDILLYSALSADARQLVPHPMPFGASVEGGGLLTEGNGVTSQFARTNGSPAGLRFQGAFTGEILASIVDLDASNQVHMFSYVGGGANAQYFLFFDSDDKWKYLHQHGAAVDDGLNLHTTSVAAEESQTLQHLTLTRSADMSRVVLYRNGRRVADAQAIASGLAPTGGSGAELRIGQAVGSRMVTLAARFFGAELTEAQAHESWQRTMFGVAA